jgi:hypothetical protein
LSDLQWTHGYGAKAVNWVLLITVYAAWGLATIFHKALPIWAL